jgi:hypothetical protein
VDTVEAAGTESSGESLDEIPTVPHLSDHDYCISFGPVKDINENLEAAREEIERLTLELQKMVTLNMFGLSRYMYNDDMIRFYTGFTSWSLLNNFMHLVRRHVSNMRTWSQVQRARKMKKTQKNQLNFSRNQTLCLEDQLFLVLCRMKLGLFEKDLAERFKISVATVSRTILTWINLLYVLLGSLPIWLSRKQIDKKMPKFIQL